jgi:hypothetical protein
MIRVRWYRLIPVIPGRAMFAGYGDALSRRETPESWLNLRPVEGAGDPKEGAGDPKEGAGMPGARCTRGPCAKVESTRVITTVAPEQPVGSNGRRNTDCFHS